jgi:hypothetical protein
MHFRFNTLLVISVLLLGACGTDSASTSPQKSTSVNAPNTKQSPSLLKRDDYLEVICGVQIQAHGSGAAPNEIVTVRIQEQVAKGIDISSEVVADANGTFILNDFCDPKSPNAEVPALWSFKGASSGRTGKNLVSYKLPDTLPSTAETSAAS